MKKILFVPLVVVLAWLGLWASNTGLLVWSASSAIPKTRDCHYFIGVSVLRRVTPLADRCPLVRQVGN